LLALLGAHHILHVSGIRVQGFIGRPRCGRKDNNEINLEDIGWQDVEWIHMAQNADQSWAFE
jgi:hypothetical protein